MYVHAYVYNVYFYHSRNLVGLRSIVRPSTDRRRAGRLPFPRLAVCRLVGSSERVSGRRTGLRVGSGVGFSFGNGTYVSERGPPMVFE